MKKKSYCEKMIEKGDNEPFLNDALEEGNVLQRSKAFSTRNSILHSLLILFYTTVAIIYTQRYSPSNTIECRRFP